MPGEYHWPDGTIMFPTNFPVNTPSSYPPPQVNVTPYIPPSDAWRIQALEHKVARLERQVRQLRLERVRRRHQRALDTDVMSGRLRMPPLSSQPAVMHARYMGKGKPRPFRGIDV